jgi:uncharacterized membrane protein
MASLESSPAARVSTRERINSVDLLRGFVMIAMALDHTRDYFSNLRFQPEDLTRSNPALFFTRWITHFCAPAFFLLAGIGAALSLSRGRSKKDLSWFLFTRGLWLVFLEITVLHFAWNFAIGFPVFLLVIWALGLSMIVLAALIFLPEPVIAAISLITIFGHNLLDGFRPTDPNILAGLWTVLHVPGMALPGKFFVGYPLIPWFAVMALGFTLGRIYRWDAPARKRFLLLTGAAAVFAFLVLRGFNLYGNPRPWSPQSTPAMTIASFLNVLKYPPSLHYLLMTLGPALMLLAVFERVRGRFADVVSVYGRVPFFYYVLHLFLIHTLAYGFAMWQGGEGGFLSLDISSFPDWYGTSLAGVYVAWLIVLALLYLPCRMYADFKSRRTDLKWTSYL